MKELVKEEEEESKQIDLESNIPLQLNPLIRPEQIVIEGNQPESEAEDAVSSLV